MPLPLPPQGDAYQIILDGFFGNLPTDKRSALWTEFTTENSISSTNPPTDTGTVEKFINFAETNYTVLLQESNDFSPNAVALRHVISNVFDVLLTLMKTAQTTAATQNALGVFLANYQNSYTNIISKVPVYTSTSPSSDPTVVSDAQIMNFDPKDASKTTFGSFAGGASLQSIAELVASNDLTKPQDYGISSPPQYLLPQPTFSGYSDTVNLVMNFHTSAADANGNVSGYVEIYTNFNPGIESVGQFTRNANLINYSFDSKIDNSYTFSFNTFQTPATQSIAIANAANNAIIAHAPNYIPGTAGPITLSNGFKMTSYGLPNGVVNATGSITAVNGFTDNNVSAYQSTTTGPLVFPWDDFYLKAYTNLVSNGTITVPITDLDSDQIKDVQAAAASLKSTANQLNQQSIQNLTADRTTISNDSDTNNTNLQTTLGDLTTLANLMKTTISQLRSVLASIYKH